MTDALLVGASVLVLALMVVIWGRWPVYRARYRARLALIFLTATMRDLSETARTVARTFRESSRQVEEFNRVLEPLVEEKP